jgi:hypothetical protein
MFEHIVKVYITGVIDFAILFTFTVMFNEAYFKIEPSSKDIWYYLTDMMYFSSIIASRTGFGDIEPNTLIPKILIIIEIYFMIFVCFIVFKGAKFYFGIKKQK